MPSSRRIHLRRVFLKGSRLATWLRTKACYPNDLFVHATRPNKYALTVPVELRSRKGKRSITKNALVDSGANTSFIHWKLVERYQMKKEKLRTPLVVRNANDSINVKGKITHKVLLAMKTNGHHEVVTFYISDLGHDDLILGYTWLRKHNPEVDWRKQAVRFADCPPFCSLSVDSKWRCAYAPKATFLAGRRQNPKVHFAERLLDSIIPSWWTGESRSTIHCFIKNPGVTPLSVSDEVFIAFPNSPDPIDIPLHCTTQSTELAAAENLKKKEKSLDEMIPVDYLDYRTVFEESTSQSLPPFRKWDHAIELKPDAIPENNCKIYPLSPGEQIALDTFLEDMTKRGYICPLQSPFASPFFFVKKKDGKLRPVQDYRQLNSLTVKNQYPLPLISDVVNKLKNARVFTKFDVRWGYNNIRIRPGDEWKAAFKTNRGMFEPLVMFFGLMNSPTTFQAMMNELFKELILAGTVFIYMDDILIATRTLEEHCRIVCQVLHILESNRLFLKPEKCEFKKDEVEYLGLRLQAGQLAMDPVKLKGIMDWPIPKKLKDVRAFLGFTGFYRRFICNYSRLTRPLNDLTKKVNPWHWGEPEQDAFDRLKQRFLEAPILVQPDLTAPFRLKCDASKYASSAVLSQRSSDGLWHPVAFMSQSFIEAEWNYDIYNRELLAIIKALREWRHYLEGSPHQLETLVSSSSLGGIPLSFLLYHPAYLW